MDTFSARRVILIDEEIITPHPPYLEGEARNLPFTIIPYTPGMNLKGIDPQRAFIISDRPEIIAQLEKMGILGLFILTSRGLTFLERLPAHWFVFHQVAEALEWIIAHPSGRKDFFAELRLGADLLKKGGLVAFPTETVYGLGADALNVEAVARIFEAKGRPLHDPLIVHVESMEQAEKLCSSFSSLAKKLAERFWPGPLTLVLPKSPAIPDLITAGLPTVAVRMPANLWARKLIHFAETPVAAPSANAFGRTSPTCARHVREQLEHRYDFLIDGGSCRVGVESTVLSLATSHPTILRPGGVTREEIEVIIGPVEVNQTQTGEEKGLQSPGLLTTHYAPRTPLILVSDISLYAGKKNVGIITFKPSDECTAGTHITLSPRGDLREAAANLYRAIRELDSMKLDLIVAQKVPNVGLGIAINDRLKRASRATQKL